VISGIFIAPVGVGGKLRGFVDQLAATGVPVSIIEDAADVAGIVDADPASVFCIALDLSHGADRAAAAAMLDRACSVVPDAPTIAITDGADGGLVIACLRSGATDVIDLRYDRPEIVYSVFERACQRHLERMATQESLVEHRGVLDEMLKDLIQTERKKLDLEFDLAKAGQPRPDLPPAPEQRAPAVVVVERDRAQADPLVGALERLGVTVLSYPSGTDAVRELTTLLRWGTTIDLAVVGGADAADAIRGLRGVVPGMSSVLLASGSNDAGDHAGNAIVWTTPVPITNLATVSKRIAQLAGDALIKTREQAYLENIKSRHERVLARYRALPR
jgi:CheY-like chemotaxis protein/FixJ family two-component response regulator